MSKKTLFVNRNAGAQDWAQENGFAAATVVESFAPDMVEAGDTVVGTLPLPLAAAVHDKGATFIALTMRPVPAELRGTPLSAEQMDELGAATQPMTVEVIDIEPTSKTVCVTRHVGAQEWLARQGINAEVQEHFTAEDMAEVGPETTVVGVLPPTMVADICQRGGCFVALDVRVPRELFKTELTADMMAELGAKLVGYRVTLG